VLSVVDGELPFRCGQYVDIHIPGTGEVRSFSMANLPSDDGHLEFMIKLYPGGRFSSLLSDGNLKAGDELEVTGPYGVFTLRDTERPLVFIGGGAGMAPILSLLRSMVEQGVTRPAVYYYGAREEQDLFHLEELAELQAMLPGFRFVPALSDAEWEGETGLITDVVDRLELDLAEVDAYLCGPPPMVDAAQELLMSRGLDEARIHFDKFTTSANTEESSPA
jgi:propane monooxygenase reductase subunit